MKSSCDVSVKFRNPLNPWYKYPISECNGLVSEATSNVNQIAC